MNKQWRVFKGGNNKSVVYKGVNLFEQTWKDTGETVALQDITGLKNKFNIYEIDINGTVEKFAIREVMKNYWMVFTSME